MKSKKQNNPIWVVTADSESGDHDGPFRFDHSPTEDELKKIIRVCKENIKRGIGQS